MVAVAGSHVERDECSHEREAVKERADDADGGGEPPQRLRFFQTIRPGGVEGVADAYGYEQGVGLHQPGANEQVPAACQNHDGVECLRATGLLADRYIRDEDADRVQQQQRVRAANSPDYRETPFVSAETPVVLAVFLLVHQEDVGVFPLHQIPMKH